jgi:flagellar biosynthesis protein FlhF
VLAAHDVVPSLAREIVEVAATREGASAGRNWQAALTEEIESRFQVEPVLGVGASRPRIVALVGPPGAGKTSSLVKLAVRYGLGCRRPVLVISMDTYRVAAADQLRSYAAILGVGFQVLDTVGALAQTLEEHQGKDLILIDTPGCSFADLDCCEDLARFLATRGDIDRQLVLSSSMKSADLSRVVDGFEIFRPGRLLFTRLDETTAPGPILNEAARTGKPLSFFATGQKIPEDLEQATPGRLVQLILGTQPGQALSAA